MERRQMLGLLGKWLGGALLGAVVLKAGGALAAAAQAASATQRKHRYGMVIDVRRCIGCKACTVACRQENKTPPGVSYTVVVSEPLEGSGTDRPIPFTKPCFHCEKPPCTDVCPVKATFKREQDGIVVVDYDRCIGCRYCITACPYGARYFDFGERYHEEANDAEDVPSPEYRQYRMRERGQSPIGNVRKCTFCLHLQDEEGNYNQAEGRWPACAKTCTGKAIFFGDFLDPNSQVSRLLRERNAIRLKEELGTEPNVYYLL
jgi:molybdopterin-containing oxidoreductase family iron-sulfur binding subunit